MATYVDDESLQVGIRVSSAEPGRQRLTRPGAYLWCFVPVQGFTWPRFERKGHAFQGSDWHRHERGRDEAFDPPTFSFDLRMDVLTVHELGLLDTGPAVPFVDVLFHPALIRPQLVWTDNLHPGQREHVLGPPFDGWPFAITRCAVEGPFQLMDMPGYLALQLVGDNATVYRDVSL